MRIEAEMKRGNQETWIFEMLLAVIPEVQKQVGIEKTVSVCLDRISVYKTNTHTCMQAQNHKEGTVCDVSPHKHLHTVNTHSLTHTHTHTLQCMHFT